jgi:hypothetical protein
MDLADTFPDQKAESGVSISDAVIEALGTVLAAVGHILDGEAMRRRGGPGIVRRLASIIAFFVAFAVSLIGRTNAIATQSSAIVTELRALRHLRRPPQCWAAP